MPVQTALMDTRQQATIEIQMDNQTCTKAFHMLTQVWPMAMGELIIATRMGMMTWNQMELTVDKDLHLTGTTPVIMDMSAMAHHQDQTPTTNQQFYYNIPANTVREDEITNGPASNTSVSPRRRPPGDTLDLSNREYRGSAFELYKKPGYSFPPNQYNDIPK